MDYDSTADTLRHIAVVREGLAEIACILIKRGDVHDASKLGEPEKSVFDRETPRLKELAYGSDEYKDSLARLGPALTHHYAANSHHPEHYDGGVLGMDLMDLVEMFCDWRAASQRTMDGSFKRSIEISSKRFNLDPQLVAIFENTQHRLKW
jgi:hypothetical protein